MKKSQPNHLPVPKRGMLVIAALLLPGLLSFIPRAAQASSSCTNTKNLTVTVSATGLVFGNYNVMNAVATAGTGGITVSATCTRATLPFTVDYTIALSTGSSGSYTPRSMASGTSALQYNLYTSPALTTIWGGGSGGTQTVADTITGTCASGRRNCSGSQTDTAYGSIPAMQNVAAGNYSDSLTVTVNF